MTGTSRHAPLVESYFDGLGEGELDRLSAAPIQEIRLHIHETRLRRRVARGRRVLETGAGGGGFTPAQARPRPDVWANVLSFEVAAAESEGYVDTGTHIIAAAMA